VAWAPAAQIAAGLVLLCLGGDWLVRGASALAARMGVSALTIGLTVVAFGTSAPELVVSLDAALSGANDISVGNVVGSNIANVALILGLAVLLRPTVVAARVVRVDAPWMVLVSLALLLALATGGVSRLEGGLLLLGLAGYVAITFREGRREAPPIQDELAAAAPVVEAGASGSALRVALGLALLVGGGHLLVAGAVEVSTRLGVSHAAIGLTVVAVGTSLPELATSVIASLRGQGDIAVGNVVGSNLFNILGIMGITAVIHPLVRGGITGLDLGLMVALAGVLALAIAFRPRLGRLEGIVLVAVWVAYTTWLLAS